MRDAAAEVLPVLPDGLKSSDKGMREVADVPRASVGQFLLGELPDALIGVQLGSVAREADEVKAVNAAAELLDEPSLMGPSSIPKKEDMAAQVS